MITYWHCEKCKAEGMVRHPKNEAVMNVVYALMREHSKYAPDDCTWDAYKIRAGTWAQYRPQRERSVSNG